MRLLFFFLIAGGIGAAFVIMVRLRRKARRRQALQQPFSDDWVEILNKNLPPYAKLSDAFRGEVGGLQQSGRYQGSKKLMMFENYHKTLNLAEMMGFMVRWE